MSNTRNGGTWNQQAKLLASDPIEFGDFGRSVAIEGDTIAVGSPEVDTGVNNRGAVYYYTQANGIWTER